LNPGVKLPIEPLALFGGTFDPVHYGHLRCADEVRKKLGLINLHLLPAGTPPHRATPLASVSQRLQMLQLALVEFPSLLLDDRETRRAGPSYMVDTLKELREEFPGRPVLLLIGQDAANHLDTWFEWESLFGLAHIVIMARPGSRREYRREITNQIDARLVSDARQLRRVEAGRVLAVEVTPIDISATAIKNLIQLGQLPRSMLPDSVLEYIDENHLYIQT
jgi:nicotinate-nucleotide adenylyltransferase